MAGIRPVGCNDCPVILKYGGIGIPRYKHGFDCKCHARFNFWAEVTSGVVQHVGCHMHVGTDAVAYIVFDDTVCIPGFAAHEFFDRNPNLADFLCVRQGGDTVPEGFPGYIG